MKVAIIIPALNPDKNLIDYVESLVKKGENCIVVVDDGSDVDKKYIFNHLQKECKCTLITHDINMGKGRALKDAFHYCLKTLNKDIIGVITVDSDGQHTIEDVMQIKKALESYPDSLILGARNFNQSDVPPKSEFGNKITRNIIRLLYGGKITDTQTGLRGLSLGILSEFINIQGERFEYETGMLLKALQKKIPIKEITIKTIYFSENKGTHFRPLMDSWKIYKLILGTFCRYSLSSLTSALLDLGLFQFFIIILGKFDLAIQIWTATIIARVVSSLYNYLINRNLVFIGNHKGHKTFIKYYILCISIMCTSAMLVYLFVNLLELPKLFVKIIVDAVLFFTSFRIQKLWIFGEHK